MFDFLSELPVIINFAYSFFLAVHNDIINFNQKIQDRSLDPGFLLHSPFFNNYFNHYTITIETNHTRKVNTFDRCIFCKIDDITILA